MAKVRGAHFHTQGNQFMGDLFSGAIRIDIARAKGTEGKYGNKSLSGLFRDAGDRLATEVIYAVKEEVDVALKQELTEAMDDVGRQISSGITSEGYGSGFKEFSKKYLAKKIYADKRRAGSPTAHLFWKKEGNLSFAYSAFALAYQTEVSTYGGLVAIHKAKRIYNGNRFRTSVRYMVPHPSVGGVFMRKIIHDSFFQRTVVQGTKEDVGFLAWEPLSVLAALETGTTRGAKARPFIARAMAKGGGHFDTATWKIIKRAERRAKAGDLVRIL